MDEVEGDASLLKLFCSENKVEDEVFISISCHNVTESTNVSMDGLETRYYISNLDSDKVPAFRFQEYILGHWEVENCLHGQKDRFFDADVHAVKQNWGVAWTILTNMGVSLARLLSRGERTLQEVRESSSHFPRAPARRLGFLG